MIINNALKSTSPVTGLRIELLAKPKYFSDFNFNGRFYSHQSQNAYIVRHRKIPFIISFLPKFFAKIFIIKKKYFIKYIFSTLFIRFLNTICKRLFRLIQFKNRKIKEKL